MANPNLSGGWTRIPETKQDSASIQTTPGQTLCIRARHNLGGNVSEWDYIQHDVTGKLVTPERPSSILVCGVQGQISVGWINPPIDDFDHVEIAVGAGQDPNDASVVYSGSNLSFVSDRVYETGREYRVFIRSVDTSRHQSEWSDGIPVNVDTLTGLSGSTRIFASYGNDPFHALGDTGNLYVVLQTGLLWCRASSGWWNTGINVHAAGPVNFSIRNSSIVIPSGQSPSRQNSGIPIPPEIADGSTASGDDGRTWRWSLLGQSFDLIGDVTPDTNIPTSLPDWIVNDPPTGCGRIIPVTRFPPKPLPEAIDGIEGEPQPAYDICVADDGTIGDYINGAWTARQVRWKPLSQLGEIIFRKDTPDEWTWFDQDPVESTANQYRERWRMVVSLSIESDNDGRGYYGQLFLRNFRTQAWEMIYQICDPDIPIPAPPRDLAITTADIENRVSVTLEWLAPRASEVPLRYRYRLFEKVQFDDDGQRINLMSGTTTLTSAAGVHDVDPPERYYMEVRSEYIGGNSKWVRIEGLIGLSCAEDPAPLAPSLSFTGVSATSGTFNGVPGITTSSTLGRITYNWGYPGSGTRPAYWAWDAGPINFNAYIQPSEAGGERGDVQLTDPDGNVYTVYPDRFPGHTNPTSLNQDEDLGSREMPGLVGLMSGRMISRCGSVFRWGQRAILDIMRAQALTPFGTPFNQNLRVENLANVTPQGTEAGTFHFQYRSAGASPSSADVTAVQILIRGWHMDEHGRPDVSDSISVYGGTRFFNVTVRADTPSGTRARNIAGRFPIHSGSGAKEIRLTTGSASTDRILVVSGMPTDFDGFYSISMRLRDAASTSVSLAQSTYGNWTSIRFQQVGTRRPPPPPTVGIPLNVRGNESPAVVIDLGIRMGTAAVRR